MNREKKMLLKSAFEAPAPPHKAAFLKSLPAPRTGLGEFIRSQIGYIRLRIWVVSFALLFTALWQVGGNPGDRFSVWVIASALPLLALVLVNELTRSDLFGMSELELSCKHPLSRIIWVRIGVLAGTAFLLLAVLLLFLPKNGLHGVTFGLCFTMPLILSTFCSLFVLNRVNVADSSALCTLVCGAVCIGGCVFFKVGALCVRNAYVLYWCGGCIILLLGIVRELIKFVKASEERLKDESFNQQVLFSGYTK